MTRKIIIADASGTRSVAQEQLPLKIGSASDADIRVAGAVSGSAFALIDVLDERPFLQPVGDAPGDRPAMQVNSEPINSTRWLGNYDVITVQGTSISCEFDDDALRFSVAYETIEYETLPPVLDESAGTGDTADTEVATITPVHRRAAKREEPGAVRRRQRAWWFGYGALALLLAFALYLFTAKAVRFDVDPPDARVQVAGSLLKFQFGGRYLLRPGAYRVMLAAEGYESLREEIEVGSAASQDFEFVLAKLPGRLTIRTSPEVVARLWIDGLDAGPLTADEVSLASGPHAIGIAADRFLDFEATVEIEGMGRAQAFEVVLVPGWADVEIVTIPAGATVYADDEEITQTPATVELMAGTRNLMVQKDGVQDLA